MRRRLRQQRRHHRLIIFRQQSHKILAACRLPPDLNRQLQELYCISDPSAYKKCLIQPAGQIDRDLIIREKSNLDRIVATLGLKEMTQGTLVRKLCTYTTTNPTRQALFEYGRLVRSIYTLKYPFVASLRRPSKRPHRKGRNCLPERFTDMVHSHLVYVFSVVLKSKYTVPDVA